MALPKSNRLKATKDIELVFKKGNAVKGNFLFIKTRKNDISVSRFGFMVPAKVINRAVARNRLKRIFSEVVRKYLSNMPNGQDMVVVVNKKGDEETMISELSLLLAKNKK